MLSPSLYVRLSLFFRDPFSKNLMKLDWRSWKVDITAGRNDPAFVKCRDFNLLPVCVVILSVWSVFDNVNRDNLCIMRLYYSFCFRGWFIIPWSKIRLEKLTFTSLVSKLPSACKSRNLVWTGSFHYILSVAIPLRYTLKLPSHLRLCTKWYIPLQVSKLHSVLISRRL